MITDIIRTECDKIDIHVADLTAEVDACGETIIAQAARIAELEEQQGGGSPLLTEPSIPAEAPVVGQPYTATPGEWGLPVASEVFNWHVGTNFISSNHSLTFTPAETTVDKKLAFEHEVTLEDGVKCSFKTPFNLPCLAAAPQPTEEPTPDPTASAWISPDGTGDGLSESAPAAPSQLNNLIAAVGPGGAVRLLPGDYHANQFNGGQALVLTNGGTAGNPVTVIMTGATIAGSRNTGDGSVPWVVPTDMSGARNVKHQPFWGFIGTNFLVLGAGANYLVFEGGNLRQLGRAFQFLTSGVHHVTFQNMELFNVQDGFYQKFADDAAGVSDLVFKSITAVGFSKRAIRLNGGTHDVLVKDCDFDSAFQSNDEFANGVAIGGRAHDIVIRRTNCRRCIDIESSGFSNGDGISIERGNFNITLEDYEASENADGGIDSKGTDIKLIRPDIHDNKVNIKLWHELEVIDGQVGSPRKATGAPYGDPSGGTGIRTNILLIAGKDSATPGAHLIMEGDFHILDDPQISKQAPANSVDGGLHNIIVEDFRA